MVGPDQTLFLRDLDTLVRVLTWRVEQTAQTWGSWVRGRRAGLAAGATGWGLVAVYQLGSWCLAHCTLGL